MEKARLVSGDCKIKVLFLNPNPRSMSVVPQTVALFYVIFKQHGIDMKFFDTSFYDFTGKYANSDKIMQESLQVVPYDTNFIEKKKPTRKGDGVYVDFRKVVEGWQPDVIMASAMESTIVFTRELLKTVRDLRIPTVLGGVFSTCAPELAISYEEVDVICIGEGENIIVPLCQKLINGENLSEIPNIWTKKNGSIIKTTLLPPTDLDANPPFDASIFDDRCFYRAMAGKIYRMFPVETHRGCIMQCTFCNSPLLEKKYREETAARYFRKKSIKNVMRDIRYFADSCDAEYIFFWSDNFLMYSRREIDEFCEAYEDIKLPFWIQSHPVTIDEYKIKKLFKVGLHRMGMGIEHGNEVFRRNVLNRNYSNQQVIEGIKILKKYNVAFSANNIVGFPTETAQLHQDTVELNRRIRPHTASCNIFTPFHGTPLRNLSLKLGYLKDPEVIAPTNQEESILEMPDFSKNEILGKSLTFNYYIKLPKSRWADIKRAEALTPEGAKIRNELRQECLEKKLL